MAPVLDLPPGTVLEELTDLAGGYASAVLDNGVPARYRYLLTRIWNYDRPPAVFLMLNPSTADAVHGDATMRRCLYFAQQAQTGGIAIVNLFAFRATDPAKLRANRNLTDEGQAAFTERIIGPHNDSFIDAAVRGPGPVIAAWGAGGILHDRAATVTARLWGAGIPLQCLGTTSTGQPRHPLYLPGDTPLQPYTVDDAA